jgi:hypothetical protein
MMDTQIITISVAVDGPLGAAKAIADRVTTYAENTFPGEVIWAQTDDISENDPR